MHFRLIQTRIPRLSFASPRVVDGGQRGQCEDTQSRAGSRTCMLLEPIDILSSLCPESRLVVVDLELADDQLPSLRAKPLQRWDVLGLHLGGVAKVIGYG
jgi:hypothetical protein